MKRQPHHRINLISYFLHPKTIFFFIIICLFSVFYFSLRQLRITTITCQLSNQPCPEQLAQLFQPLVGQSIFFANLETVINQQLRDQSFQLIKIQKRLPNNLMIQLQPIEPVYSLQLENQTLTVDRQGDFQAQQISGLPTITVRADCPIINQDGRLNLKIHTQILLFWQQLQTNQLTPETVQCLSANTVLVKISHQPQFVLEPDDLAQQVQKLIVIHSSLKLDTFNPSIREVDLRFNQPVLRENPVVNEMESLSPAAN